MKTQKWRKKIIDDIDQDWDIIIIGGGITGAGIFREATRIGLKTCLIEQKDFAWGTSSRSSKLVHGGLRYLKDGHLLLTRASVKERERLLGDGPGLIDPLGFLLAIYRGDFPGRWTYKAGLTIYDLLALQWGHRYYGSDTLKMLAPHISHRELKGGFRYGDAQTDDARLVFRLIQEAIDDGGIAINYMMADELIMGEGVVDGIRITDCETGEKHEVRGKVIVNATGVWADRLRSEIVPSKVIRPLRGSHLLFPSWRLPVAQAVCFLHPFDKRPVFIFPWEGITIVGTTDVDHHGPLEEEPSISSSEISYLIAAVEAQFPSLNIGLDDIRSTFSGVRPVIGTGKIDPSQESRDHMVLNDRGLVTVTGGKLTTFRILALEVLKNIRSRIPDMPAMSSNYPVLNQIDVDSSGIKGLDKRITRRLIGRYGKFAKKVVDIADEGELETIPGTETLWAEIRWATRSEYVCHLDDLMLRRVRLGLTLPNGAEKLLPKIKAICQSELNWDDNKWDLERENYLKIWNSSYYLPKNHKNLNRGREFKLLQLRKNSLNHKDLIKRMTPFLISSFLVFILWISYCVWKKFQKKHQ